MAYIKSFTKNTKQKDGKHTDVDCVYYILEIDNQTVIQFDTFGSASRQFEGKASQSIRLDRENAKIMFEILKSEFGFK